ncbi:MAG: hydroxymethylglutaryl-CoA reductase [Gemmatimonadetes bacterium]|nr:hydroxymethylglutaryl-CoA reductase [Gemmatimonadota bacterium]MYD14667.1 hydroxymethylglutaryl-CoA reductase [Gemmatimonadota bacterium]MYI64706.1 hydroxymethylglutaryl-CoA reductase [Gemmatimonadota bacterium]
MAIDLRSVRNYFGRLLADRTEEEIEQALTPSRDDISPHVPRGDAMSQISPEAVDQRWELLDVEARSRESLLDAMTREQMGVYSKNIENFIGTVKLPIGLAGPLRVRGLYAQGDYYAPLATTEAALVASYTRGAQAITLAGGCTTAMFWEGVTRAPVFAFDTLIDVGKFLLWAGGHEETFRTIVASTTRHGELIRTRFNLEGNHVYLIFEYSTGDAAGQNMVTIATEAICRFILEHTPVQPAYWFVEANLSGDKKASHLSFQNVRGRKATAEVTLTADILQGHLKSSARRMLDFYRVSSIGGVMSGNIGIQGHYSNGMAALYIACGQDAACVAESAVGVTRFEPAGDGSLYAAVTLPNVIVGTVGGGTGLPSQNACLQMMNLAGPGKAAAFAEVCAALVLAGELSIIAALSAGHFTHAHQSLARGPAGGANKGNVRETDAGAS